MCSKNFYYKLLVNERINNIKDIQRVSISCPTINDLCNQNNIKKVDDSNEILIEMIIPNNLLSLQNDRRSLTASYIDRTFIVNSFCALSKYISIDDCSY
ncbi:hypothetical protein [Clostridium tertium]|uniref:hypothetical protein n=1 Tax=Clostridium tertium TaxID=1559 RepID=UPI0023B24115|nr:hypothetical protein [Clostridium tertium]